MQTPLNLWLWAYKSTRMAYSGYHLRADEEACQTIIARLSAPGFTKSSFQLRAVPDRMPLILAPADVGFRDFTRLRIQAAGEEETAIQTEENGAYLDLHLNAEGRKMVCADLSEMVEGRWDYSGIGSIWYWGLLSEADYQKSYG